MSLESSWERERGALPCWAARDALASGYHFSVKIVNRVKRFAIYFPTGYNCYDKFSELLEESQKKSSGTSVFSYFLWKTKIINVKRVKQTEYIIEMLFLR